MRWPMVEFKIVLVGGDGASALGPEAATQQQDRYRRVELFSLTEMEVSGEMHSAKLFVG